MDADNFDLARGIIPNAYINQASDAYKQRTSLFKSVIAQRKVPDKGWPDALIDALLNEISLMDSNNFPGVYLLLVFEIFKAYFWSCMSLSSYVTF